MAYFHLFSGANYVSFREGICEGRSKQPARLGTFTWNLKKSSKSVGTELFYLVTFPYAHCSLVQVVLEWVLGT